MRNNKLAAALALGISALGLSAARPASRPRSRATRRCPRRRARASSSCRWIRAMSAGSNSRATPRMVAQAMQAQGYVPAASINQATMVVQLGYGVDQGRSEVIDAIPSLRWLSAMAASAMAASTAGLIIRAAAIMAPLALLLWLERSVLRLSYGGIRSYTVYKSNLDLDIRRKVDNASLFEGHAKARSHTDDSACSFRTWSRRCSPASPAVRARRSRSPSRQPPPVGHALLRRDAETEEARRTGRPFRSGPSTQC